MVSSYAVSEIDAPTQVLAIRSGFISGPPLPETRATLAMSFARDEEGRTITDSYRSITVPRLSSAVILRKQMPVVASFFANKVIGISMIEHAITEPMSLRMSRVYRLFQRLQLGR